MPFVTPGTPNLVDFDTWLSTSVGIPASAWPSDDITMSEWPGYALEQAEGFVLCIPCVPGITYTLAVYNLATALLFQIAPNTSPSTYFTDARSNIPSTNFPSGGFNLNAPAMGLVTAASDEGTSSTLATPDWATKLTVGQLALFNTPWGRAYLSFEQSYGPTIWGLT